ncbi:MAG: hypothetical protein IJG23_04115 [Clostridia bacterium]|nr:hypothetical protein [Clostridia bacterium]
MKSKKSIVITILCVILSLSIGFGAGFLVGKNPVKMNNSSNNYSCQDFNINLKKCSILKVDSKQLEQYFPYDYDKFSDFPNCFECLYTFENQSNNSLIPSEVIEFKLFINGKKVENGTNSMREYILEFCHYLNHSNNDEIQIGRSAQLQFCIILDGLTLSADDTIELNLVNKKTSDVLKVFKLDYQDFSKQTLVLKDDGQNGSYVIDKD